MVLDTGSTDLIPSNLQGIEEHIKPEVSINRPFLTTGQRNGAPFINDSSELSNTRRHYAYRKVIKGVEAGAKLVLVPVSVRLGVSKNHGRLWRVAKAGFPHTGETDHGVLTNILFLSRGCH